jgi:hypothetical protein
VTKEGSQPLDDDFDLATYDARDVNEMLISQAIPEFIGPHLLSALHDLLRGCSFKETVD